MSDTESQARLSGNAVMDKAPLEDIMVAMDVVDTLRHETKIVQRELDEEGRRGRLLERLRELYAAQGIEVPDEVLLEGIEALEQERFRYVPTPESWRTKLARLWVNRGRWGKPLSFLSVLGGLFYGVYFATDVMPEMSLKAGLPKQVDASIAAIINESKMDGLIEDAQTIAQSARLAIEQNKFDEAQEHATRLANLEARLKQDYEIRVISRPNANSGIWRIPEENPDARNYYLIVEAIDNDNSVVEIDVVGEEDNKSKRLRTWGLRVNEATFFRVAADKKDDGIIQNNVIGQKKRGFLEPVFSVPTTGATLTEW